MQAIAPANDTPSAQATSAPTTPDAIIGERIHQELWRRQIPQARLADALGLATSILGRRMRGRTAWRAGELLTVAQFLGLPVEELLAPAEAAQ